MNLYDILEVSPKASEEVIRNAYKALAKKYHPDVLIGSDKSEAEAKMKRINNAFEVLGDPSKREKYDESLRKVDSLNQRTESGGSTRHSENASNSYNSDSSEASYSSSHNRESSSYETTDNSNNNTSEDGIPKWLIPSILALAVILLIVSINGYNQNNNYTPVTNNNGNKTYETPSVGELQTNAKNHDLNKHSTLPGYVDYYKEFSNTKFLFGSIITQDASFLSDLETKQIIDCQLKSDDVLAVIGEIDGYYDVIVLSSDGSSQNFWVNVNDIDTYWYDSISNSYIPFKVRSNNGYSADTDKKTSEPQIDTKQTDEPQNSNQITSDIQTDKQSIDELLNDKQITTGNYITIGSNKDTVKKIMGNPENIAQYTALDQEDWSYEYSTITFNNQGLVKGWDDNSNNLIVYMGDKVKGTVFEIGSSKADVIKAMGTPNGIVGYPALDQEDWSYKYSTVTFNNQGLVKGWDDTSNNLSIHMGKKVQGAMFKIGSSKADVIKAMGTPDGIVGYPALDQEDWRYEYSTVTFNNQGLVKGWDDTSDNLNIE